MVGYDLNDGSLFNYIMDTQNLWSVYNMVPLLALDVYEHAYVRDFGATPDGRKQYVEAFFRNLDWDHINRQLIQAEAAKDGAEGSGAREPAHTGCENADGERAAAGESAINHELSRSAAVSRAHAA